MALKRLVEKIEFCKAKDDTEGIEKASREYTDALDRMANEAEHTGHTAAAEAFATERERFVKETNEPRPENYQSLAQWTEAVEKHHGVRSATATDKEERKRQWQLYDHSMSIKFGEAWTQDPDRKKVLEEIEKHGE